MHWIPMTWRGNNMSSDIPVLSVRNLSVSYKEKSVVKNVSFDLRSGESIALVGESGCGKSTILRAVMRILPDQGRVSGGDICMGTHPSLLCIMRSGNDCPDVILR